MSALKKILDSNKNWVNEKIKNDPSFFYKHAKNQSPKFLYIGCCDSRIIPNKMMGLDIGELFVYRNIGNLFSDEDKSIHMALKYAVETLNINNIIICGHFGCGAIETLLWSIDEKKDFDSYLKPIYKIYLENKNKVDDLKDFNEKVDKLAVLSVKDQVKKIEEDPLILNAKKMGRNIQIYGLIYDLKTGLLKEI